MISKRMMMPTRIQILIFTFFHHICLRTRLAPRRNPCADWLRFSDLSWSWSMCSPRWATDSRFFFITLTVSSICCDLYVSKGHKSGGSDRLQVSWRPSSTEKDFQRRQSSFSKGARAYRLDGRSPLIAAIVLSASALTGVSCWDVRIVWLFTTCHRWKYQN